MHRNNFIVFLNHNFSAYSKSKKNMHKLKQDFASRHEVLQTSFWNYISDGSDTLLYALSVLTTVLSTTRSSSLAQG